MTSQATQIQTLINEIDAALSKSSTRLPWVMSGEAMQQRRVLEQTRQYLVELQTQTAEREAVPQAPPPSTAAEESAQHVLQAVLQEMGYLRSHILQPLRADIDRLHQEREALTAEIRQLQEQRQQALPPQAGQQQLIEDFMRSLMSRVQEQLAVQVTQTVANFSIPPAELPGLSMGALPGNADLATLTPEQRVAQVQKLQAQSDQLLLKLDSTLRVIFESLQTNMQGYQESLGQGLEKMHSLGQQGEAMFAALVNRLAQQLGREASSYLQSSFQPGEWKSVATSQLLDASSLQPLETSPAPSPEATSTFDDISDGQIDQLLEELKAGGISLEEDVLAPSMSAPTPQPTVEPTASPEPSVNAEDEAIALPEEEAPFPLEPIAELAVSEDAELDSWSFDADLETLDAAFDIIGDLSAQSGSDEALDLSTHDSEDNFYESLFGVEFTGAEPADPEVPPAVGDVAIAQPQSLPVDESLNVLDLFGGLADPAEVFASKSLEELPRRDEALSELSTQALEGVLFPDTEPLFSEERFAGSTAPAPSEDGMDSSSLDELADERDEYTLALPDEDLLSEEGPVQTPSLELNLDDGTLSQLAADLRALESPDEPYTILGFEDAIAPEPDAPPAEKPPSLPLDNEPILLGLDTIPSEPSPSVINDGTLTQPTLNSFFAGVADEAPDTQFTLNSLFPGTTNDEVSSAVDSSSPTASRLEEPVELPAPSAPPVPGLDDDLNLIWESLESPEAIAPPSQPAPPASAELGWTLADAFADVGDPAAVESPEAIAPPSQPVPPASAELGWTLDDAFADVSDPAAPEMPQAGSSAVQEQPELTLNDFGITLDVDDLGLSLGEFGDALDAPNTVANGATPGDRPVVGKAFQDADPLTNGSEPPVTLGNYFEALDGPAQESPSLEAVLEEQDIFALDNLTLENLFEDWPGEQPAGTSKKN